MKMIEAPQFDETIEKGLVLVDFFADWCGPCKMLGPVLEEADKEYPDIEFVKFNVDKNDENMNIAVRYGIMSIPAVFIFRDGEIIGQMAGYRDIGGVRAFIDETVKQ